MSIDGRQAAPAPPSAVPRPALPPAFRSGLMSFYQYISIYIKYKIFQIDIII